MFRNSSRIYILSLCFLLITDASSSTPSISSTQTSTKVLWVPLSGTVELGLSPYIQRALRRAEEEKFEAIVLEIDTLGGRVDAALTIRDALLNSKLLTVAWVNKRAISAGALIALGCRKIFFTTGSTMGAATPIEITSKGPSDVEEKFVSYFRKEMGSTAETNGRPRKIAESMVKAEDTLPDLVKKGEVLTLTDRSALDTRISNGTLNSRLEILQKLNLPEAEVIEFQINWAERIVRFVTEPTVSNLLMSGGVLGLVLEFQHPGLGLPGLFSLLCFGLFFFGKFLVHLAGWEELILFFFGIALIAIEVFLLPGKMLPGVIGVTIVLFSLFMAGVSHNMPFDLHLQSVHDHLNGIALAIVVGLSSLILFYFILSRNPRRSPLVLNTALDSHQGYRSSEDYSSLLGRGGEATTDLKPTGKASFDSNVVEVLTRGEYITHGQEVQVVAVEGGRIFVRALPKIS